MSLAQRWAPYLERMRWFQGKGLTLRSLTLQPLDWYVAGPDLWLRSELAHLDLGGVPQTYHLLVAYARPGTLVDDAAVVGQAEVPGLGTMQVLDAPRSPSAMHRFLEAITRSDAPGIAWETQPVDPAAPLRLLTGEQSHTSVAVGDTVLLKLYRRLASGPSLEPEVLGDLARVAGSPVPALVGTWRTPDGVDLGFFQQLIPHARDGYQYAVQACAAGESLADPMQRLGATLARLHHNLREVYPAQVARTSELIAAVRGRLGQACDELPRLDALRPGLQARLSLPDADVALQRVHGDFHLGQTLLDAHGWTIIDFEGEPLKTPQERRAPDSVWRDVAGLLRSLDYARYTHPHPDSPAARTWLRQACNGFLAGYCGDSHRSAPPLLHVYELDKAVYELRYETRNRPDWAGTPWNALLEMSRSGAASARPNESA